MKTKLTLTVQKRVIEAAKKRSRKTGKSISSLFEEIFEKNYGKGIQSEAQRAAARLLESLEASPITVTQNDKVLLKAHIAKKYA